MQASGSKSLPSVGFLTVVEDQEHGLFGGYLVVNALSRPLEFHCTTPVRANRAQEILYGATLKPYLYGEQIGQTLLSKAKSKPLLVCTDCESALSVRGFVSTPVVLVSSGETSQPASPPTNWRIDSSTQGPPAPKLSLVRFALGDQQVALESAYARDRDAILANVAPNLKGLDFLEPFERIREAIDEAKKGG
jgi:hypothetical protein